MEQIYQTLAEYGYSHPLHPPLTHIPAGMLTGALVFSLLAVLAGRPHLAVTARHCLLLALAGVFPTSVFGYLDWIHFYGGAWLPQIEVKIGLALVLTALLAGTGLLLARRDEAAPGFVLLYLLCFLTVGALGYFGGDLVFGKRAAAVAAESGNAMAGEEVYRGFCQACHPGGGNTVKAALPLKDAPQLKDLDTFVAYLRNPRARDGSQTLMSPFPVERLSARQASDLHQYLIRTYRVR